MEIISSSDSEEKMTQNAKQDNIRCSNSKVDDSVIFQCGECGNSFQPENDINIHYKTHDDECQKCSLHKEQENILAKQV